MMILLKESYTQFHLTVKWRFKQYEYAYIKKMLKSVIYNRNSDIYICSMVASWAYEVTLILKQ